MQKVLKRLAIFFAVLILILVVTASVAVWFVFTPEKLTPIVRNQASKYITCQSQIGEVELTFFSTFPKFGIKVNRFALINHIPGAPSDTLVKVKELVGIVDVEAWWKRNELIVNEVHLADGKVNAFVDSLKRSNFDIVKADTTAPKKSSSSSLSFIDLRNIKINDVDVSYFDESQKLNAKVVKLTAQLSGKFAADTVNADVNIENGITSLTFSGQEYLNSASLKANTQLRLVVPAQRVEIRHADLAINKLGLSISGMVDNNPEKGQVLLDLSYRTKWMSIADIISLVPPAYKSYLNGADAHGEILTEGKIKGAYSASFMPLLDVHLKLKDGMLKYKGFQLPLSQINGDVAFYSNLKDDKISYLQINSFSAKTPQSSVQTQGKITHLLTDIHCNLVTKGDFDLSEFAPMIPAKLKMRISGRTEGKISSAFSLSQVQKMQLEKMQLSGALKLSDFMVDYDTISIKSTSSDVDFALPGSVVASKRAFLSGKLTTKGITATTSKGGYALINDGWISFSTSDFRDSTRIPNVSGKFDLKSLSVRKDTIRMVVNMPVGQFTMAPLKGKVSEPELNASFKSEALNGEAGSTRCSMDNAQIEASYLGDKAAPRMRVKYFGSKVNAAMAGNTARIDKLNLDANLLNDKNQPDKFRQWQADGFVQAEGGNIATTSLKYPLEIPSVQLNFTPEVFNIKESRVKVGNSDFNLAGKLSNILSYLKKDSLLRGNFRFVSNKTDIVQLMMLTNGFGDKEAAPAPATPESGFPGPYMVPKGVDVQLNVDVSSANYGTGVASDIKGLLRVKDGVLVLDNLAFVTPAAKMMLSTVYKTPRRNHLYVGLDLQMMNIEIAELLKTVPDIDTIMPMLRSFSGKGDFHMAAETYLDSLYNPKMSTVRGAASIKGQDLVLMDGQTFSEIAKTLRFSKKTQNRIDSLTAEFTVFKNEIDIFPFLIVMDKYKGVVAGKHNLDMTFNYHISVVDSPLPFRFGIDITGKANDLKYRPAKCRFAEFYRPVARGELKRTQLELRRIIRESLLKKGDNPNN